MDPPRPLHSTLRVLVVDDSRDEADALAILVGLWGYEPLVAYTATAALAAALAGRPDVILLAIRLPGMDGYEVARRLRAAPEMERVLFVAVTGAAGEEDRPRFREAGFDHLLFKPYDPEHLRRLLDLTAGLIRESRRRIGATASPAPEAQPPGQVPTEAPPGGEVAEPLPPGS